MTVTARRKADLRRMLSERRRAMQDEVQSRIRDGRTDRPKEVSDDFEQSDADAQRRHRALDAPDKGRDSGPRQRGARSARCGQVRVLRRMRGRHFRATAASAAVRGALPGVRRETGAGAGTRPPPQQRAALLRHDQFLRSTEETHDTLDTSINPRSEPTTSRRTCSRGPNASSSSRR